VALDLGNAPEAETVFARAAQEAGGGFDVVINNAGYGVFGWFAQTEYAQWQGQIDAMLSTTALLSHLALRQMLARQRGCLVNVTSLAVEFPLPFMSGYNIVKAGLSALSESLIFETRGTPLNVIDFRPGDYRTNFNLAMPPLPALAAPTAADELRARSWRILDANLKSSPLPSRAASDLRRALRRQRSGTVRSGTIFQARIGPFISRCSPAWLRRAVLARYFGAA
jgi:short-subunit dehydrogenase